jgi:hypothetical protein
MKNTPQWMRGAGVFVVFLELASGSKPGHQPQPLTPTINP